MSLGAITGLTRELRRVGRENRSRAVGAARGDLLAQAAKAERIAGQLRIPELMAVAAVRIGEILLASADPQRANRAFEHAEDALNGLRRPDLAVVIAARRTEALAALNLWDEVEWVADAGIELVERYRYKVSSPFLQTAYLKSRIALYSLGAMAALRRSDIDTALQRCELAKARGVLADFRGSEDAKEGPAEDLKTRLASVNLALENAEARGDHATAEELRAERQVVWDLLMMKRRRRQVGASQSQSFTLAGLQARLAPDQAVLYHFWLEPTRLLQVVLDRRRVWFDSPAVEPELARELDACARRILSAGSDGARPPDDLLDDVRRFDGLLWPTHRDAQAILADARRIVVSPHRKLHALPLHALKLGGRFLIETHAFRFVPNLSCLLQPPARRRSGGVVAIGVREFHVPGIRLAPLPQAEHEAEAVAAIYRGAGHLATALVGPQASERELRRGSLADAGCVHFACHGTNVDPQSPMEASLYLRDGKLEGIELPLLDLTAHLIVLTACCSGQRWLSGRHLDELPGDDVMGLQAAFFAAGAREILSTLCPVKDQPGMLISTGFHRHHANGTPSDLAWQTSIKDYLAEARLPDRHRASWAPFQLIATTL